MAEGMDAGITDTVSAVVYRQGSLLPVILFIIISEVPVNLAGKGIFSVGHATRKVILSFFVDDVFVYLQKSRDSRKKLLR